MTDREDPDKLPGEFQVGDLIGGTYVIIDYLGRGAMGHVYYAKHAMLNAEYALKTLSSEKVSELEWKRFQTEAQAIAKLTHPNIVSIYNFGRHEQSVPFYVMDVLKGVDLARRLREQGPLDAVAAARIFAEVCEGIGYAHTKGIVHRDLKPGNIFLLAEPGPTGALVKVVDFGVAKLTEQKNQDLQSLTGVGDVVGTPYYMSPEQCMALNVDARSDIYSLGCCLFESLTGNLPFRGRNPTETMMLHDSAPPPTLKKGSGGKEFNPGIQNIVAKCLAKSPDQRYQSAEELGADLQALVAAAPPPEQITQLVSTAVEPSESAATLYISGANVGRLQGRSILFVALCTLALLIVAAVLFRSMQRHNLNENNAPISAPQPSTPIFKNANRPTSTKAVKDETLPANQIVSASLMIDKPFASISSAGGGNYRTFNFPTDCVIGLISDGAEGPMVRAVGKIQYAAEAPITFAPSEIVGRYPRCLKRFRAGDVHCIKFIKNCDGDAIVKAASQIPDVEMLDFDLCWGMSAACVDSLNQFQTLKIFSCAYSMFDGEILARATCWGQLNQLSLADFRNLSAFLPRLKEMRQLRRLGIKNSHLSDADFSGLAAVTQIQALNLDGTYVTRKNLDKLTGMSNLQEIDIRNTLLDSSATAELRQFKNLKTVYIQSSQLPSGQLEKIKAALPGAKIY